MGAEATTAITPARERHTPRPPQSRTAPRPKGPKCAPRPKCRIARPYQRDDQRNDKTSEQSFTGGFAARSGAGAREGAGTA